MRDAGRDGIGGPSGEAGRGERGAALIVMTVTVMVAASLATALLLVAATRAKSTEARIGLEKALAIAEAGLCRGLAEANLYENKSNPAWPPEAGVTLSGVSAEIRDAVNPAAVVGRCVTTITSGLYDGIDNDGDGLVDEPTPNPVVDTEDPGEDTYIIIESTGYFGEVSDGNPHKVRVRGMCRKMRNEFYVGGALTLGGDPNLDITTSNAFTLDGRDHDDDTNTVYDPPTASNPGLPALAITADAADMPTDDVEMIQAAYDGGNLKGVVPTDGTSPWAASEPSNPVDKLVAWASQNYTFSKPDLLPGNFDYENVIYHKGDTSITGSDMGAGIWVVDGNLKLGGTAQFRGILIVTGVLTLKGGGATNLIKGAAIVGGTAVDLAEVDPTDPDGPIDFANTGTTDVKYSSEAVTKAKNGAVTYAMVAWQQLTTEL